MIRECKHPTCGNTCRREKKKKNAPALSRRQIKGRTDVAALSEMDHATLLQLAVHVFNAYIRRRDQNMGCISCEKGKVEQAGHFHAAGKFSGVRFDEINVNGQCKLCNEPMDGNLEGYYTGLIARYGADVVKALENRANETKLYKWTREELIDIIVQFKTK
jgi:hypothetical protein